MIRIECSLVLLKSLTQNHSVYFSNLGKIFPQITDSGLHLMLRLSY